MRYLNRKGMGRPLVLDSPAGRALRRDLDAYVAAAEASQQRRAPVDRHFLQESEIGLALMAGFKGACAYCETPVTGTARPAATHHRPPGFAANAQGETDFLHYVWLAYEWANFYLVCDICAKHKENRFPVRKGRGRPGASIEELRKVEGELLLDPCFHDPSEHLQFDAVGVVVPRSEAGETTIKTLGLNRLDLVESRRKAYVEIARLIVPWRDVGSVPTGLGPGRGGEVVSGHPSRRLAHSGATSLLLLDLAKRAGVPSENLTRFFDYMRRQMPGVRAEIIQDLDPSFAPATPSRPPETEAAAVRGPAPKRAPARRRSRPFRLGGQPLAKVPISQVRIENFRALQAVEFALPVSVDDPELVPCMLILGENAAGKSSVLEALTLALLGTAEIAGLDALLTEDDIRPRDLVHRPDPSNFEILGEDPISVEIGFLSLEQKVRITGGAEATLFEGSPETVKVLLAYGPRRFFSHRKTRRLRAPSRRVRSLFDPMATIANPENWLLSCARPDFDAAVRALREILMLSPAAEFNRESGRLLIETETGQLPLDEMSVGYKSVIAMATDIMRELMYHYDNIEYAHAVVVIDEIETHLHPRWKMQIVGLLRRAFPKVQFIITTHDPLCLRGMYDGEVFVLRRNDENRRVESLEELPAIRGMRAEQILMSEFFGLGSTDPETDAKLMRYHHLVSQGEATPEVERLRGEIESTMKVGDTIQEQVAAEAMREADIDPVAPLGKVRGKSRRDMVEALVGKIDTALESQRGE